MLSLGAAQASNLSEAPLAAPQHMQLLIANQTEGAVASPNLNPAATHCLRRRAQCMIVKKQEAQQLTGKS